MNAQLHYEQNLAIIKAIPPEKTIQLTMPQEHVCSEAQELDIVANEDKEDIMARGLSSNILESLPIRTGAFTYAAALYELDSQGMSEVQEIWEKKKEEGYLFKKKLINEMKFAFRNNQLAQKELSEIKAGKGHRDMVIDLLEIEIVGREHLEELANINFDMSLLDKAKELHEEVTKAYAEMKVHQNQINEKRQTRDQAFTWLKEIVDEIREFGRFVYSDNPEKIKRYISEYYHEIRGKVKNKKEEETVSSELL